MQLILSQSFCSPRAKQANEYNPLCAHKSPQLLLEMEGSLRGTDIKHDRDDKRKDTVWTSACEVAGCASAEDSVQFMTYLCRKCLIYGTYSFIYLWTCTVCLNNEFIIYWRQDLRGSHFLLLQLDLE